MSHTPEPWIAEGDHVNVYYPGGGSATVCKCGTGFNPTLQGIADARRIAACVNACKGISTEELERRANEKEVEKTGS